MQERAILTVLNKKPCPLGFKGHGFLIVDMAKVKGKKQKQRETMSQILWEYFRICNFRLFLHSHMKNHRSRFCRMRFPG